MRFDPTYNQFKNCICATGDETDVAQTEESANKKVMKLQSWQYIRAGLALIGAFVVVTWAWKKLKK